MKVKNPFLDILAKGHDQILAFDCEFWHVAGLKGYPKVQGQDYSFFPRELGGVLFTKIKEGEWDQKGKFFVTFPPPVEEVSFVTSKQASTGKTTRKKLDQLETYFDVPWNMVFKQNIPEALHEQIDAAHEVQESDSAIKKARADPKQYYPEFIEMMSKSVAIVKGDKDFEALKNATRFYKLEQKRPIKIVDIAMWNNQSRKKCGSAKLEDTQDCISDELNDTGTPKRRLRDLLPVDRAHDPTSDAAMTLLVALFIVAKHSV